MLPWVVVGIGLLLRGLVFADAGPPADAADLSTADAAGTADVVQSLAADW